MKQRRGKMRIDVFSTEGFRCERISIEDAELELYQTEFYLSENLELDCECNHTVFTKMHVKSIHGNCTKDIVVNDYVGNLLTTILGKEIVRISIIPEEKGYYIKVLHFRFEILL